MGGSPVVLASIGTYSGPASSSLKPIVDGAQLWVKFINGKGGLRGHPVKFLIYDDGADPARHKSQAQEAIEQRKAIAFLANAEIFTGAATAAYLAEKRVPVIGTEGGQDYPYENPMYFLQHSSGSTMFVTFVWSTGQLAVQKGKTKLGTLTCYENDACPAITRVFRERARSVGLDLVYEGRTSIAQPDYTAECLAARNAGVQTFFVALDSNSVTRLTGSCARQGYSPLYAVPNSIVLERFKDDPSMEGGMGSTTVFPWFQTGTPATDEFHRAVQAYGGGMQAGVGQAVGWTAGKLLERASVTLTEPPTSQSLLQALWTIKADTLGGLAYPLTFTEGQPAARKSCYFNIAIKKGAWISPDAFKLTCAE